MARDSGSIFAMKVERMFDAAIEDVERIGQAFIAAAADQLIETTPGPDLQFEGTEYIATGRLRGGWYYGSLAPVSVSQVEGGPYDLSRNGSVTKARLRAKIFDNGIQRISFLWNEVGYGYYVHYGLENHVDIGPRPWVYDASKLGEEFLAIAMSGTGGLGD